MEIVIPGASVTVRTSSYYIVLPPSRPAGRNMALVGIGDSSFNNYLHQLHQWAVLPSA